MRKSELIGLVACGGKSMRMGMDKSLIVYHEKSQRYHIYEMLQGLCDHVILSCNEDQAIGIPGQYALLTDLPDYRIIGPMAALLTAFSSFPGHDFLMIGCDYPLLTSSDLSEFLEYIDRDKIASAFYKTETSMYEPLLALYSARSEETIHRMYQDNKYSLQHFLKENEAGRFESPRPDHVISVDTPEEYQKTKELLNRNKKFKS